MGLKPVLDDFEPASHESLEEMFKSQDFEPSVGF